MRLNLHANAATTPRIRAYIQASTASASDLAAELGISRRTVDRWRGREGVTDRTCRPKRIGTSLSALEEGLLGPSGHVGFLNRKARVMRRRRKYGQTQL